MNIDFLTGYAGLSVLTGVAIRAGNVILVSGDGDLKGGGEDGMVTMELSEVSLDSREEGAVDLSDCVDDNELFTEF